MIDEPVLTAPAALVPDPPQPPDPVADRAWDLTFERSPIGMAVVLPDGSWARVNEALCLMLGRSPDELHACTFQDITHPDDLAADVELLEECLAGRRDGYRTTKRYVHANGDLVWGDLSVALVRHPDGRPMHFVSQILDITDQHRDRDRLEGALERLARANEDLEAFAAIASHELKTPLAGVRAGLELIRDLLETPDATALSQVRALAARGESSVDRMATLLDALLALTVTKTGGADGDGGAGESTLRRPVALAVVVEATLGDLPASLRLPDVTIEVAPGVAAAPPVAVEPNLVRTVLTTLVANAVKYRDAGRHLTVVIDAGEPDDGSLTVCVANDGPPIPAAERERVFSLHSRGSSTTAVTGSGIGLAVSRSIVEWHGGRIWIDGGPTSGVTVAFTLPLAPH
ncbi:hypothetical protein GCM10023340_00300 [Nocardioides marinquilinus]|uniref:histidine kinase n=1 Tax=Nocardioides marinquilinus TaxID=1210400 RepID=A0ABP9P3R9_9ACTN